MARKRMTNHEPQFFSQPSLARPRPADTRISPIFAHSLQTSSTRARAKNASLILRLREPPIRARCVRDSARVDPFVLILHDQCSVDTSVCGVQAGLARAFIVPLNRVRPHARGYRACDTVAGRLATASPRIPPPRPARARLTHHTPLLFPPPAT